jgi:hypothetical protein
MRSRLNMYAFRALLPGSYAGGTPMERAKVIAVANGVACFGALNRVVYSA